MSIEIEPGTKAQEPAGSGPIGPRLARPWWMRPAMHTGIIGAIIGYFIGHWLGNFLSYEYARNALSDMNDFPLVLGYVIADGRLAGRAGRVQRPRPADPRQAGPGGGGRRGSLRRGGPVLPVLAGPQGGRHPVPGRDDHLLLHRGPVRHGDPDRAALADLPHHECLLLPDGGRRARHDDDDADDVGRARPVRQLPDAADDRVQADGVPAAGGAGVLAHPGGVHHPAVQRAARRVPHRLDRLRAAERAGHRGHGRLRGGLRPDGDLGHPGRVQHHRDRDQLPGARHAVEQAADVRLVHGHRLVPDGAGHPGPGRRPVPADPRPHGGDRELREHSSAAAATCTRTCSGSSGTRRSTSWPCPGSASCRRSSRCSAANRSSATGSPGPA